MSLLLQHFLVLTIVAVCVGTVGWQGLKGFFGRRSKLGSCCAKGCEPPAPTPTPTEKVQFIPVDMLARRK
jgi:hypothetical protein